MAAPDNEDTDEFIEPVTIALEAGQEAAGQGRDADGIFEVGEDPLHRQEAETVDHQHDEDVVTQ